MRSGSLRYRGEIQIVTTTRSPSGGVIAGPPQTFAVISFQIQTIGVLEHLVAGTIQSELTHTIVCRYIFGVVPTMQVLGTSGPFKGRIFEIIGTDESARKRGELTLHCREFKTVATP